MNAASALLQEALMSLLCAVDPTLD